MACLQWPVCNGLFAMAALFVASGVPFFVLHPPEGTEDKNARWAALSLPFLFLSLPFLAFSPSH